MYILKADERYKIGISKTGQPRIKSIRTASPEPIVIAKIIKVSDMRSAEKHLHKLFDDVRVHLEWFSLTPGNVQKVMEYLESKKLIDSNYRDLFSSVPKGTSTLLSHQLAI